MAPQRSVIRAATSLKSSEVLMFAMHGPLRRLAENSASDRNTRLAMWNRRWRGASFATAILIVGVGAVAAIADGPDQDVVPRYQEFSDSEGRFANFNIGGPTNTK